LSALVVSTCTTGTIRSTRMTSELRAGYCACARHGRFRNGLGRRKGGVTHSL
jgi:hypothetical protein